MSTTTHTYRVELERLDHGYEARVPSIHGCSSIGLTEGETIRRIHDEIGLHIGRSGLAEATADPIRLEIFRT